MTHDDGTQGRQDTTAGTADLPRFRPRLPRWAVAELRAHPGRLAAIILAALVAFGVSGVVAWSQRPGPVRAAPPVPSATSSSPATVGPGSPWPSAANPAYTGTPGVPTATTGSATPKGTPTGRTTKASPSPRPTSPKPTPKPTPTPEPTDTGEDPDEPELPGDRAGEPTEPGE